MKLKIIRPNGQEEIIEVKDYTVFDPFAVVPEQINLTPNQPNMYSNNMVSNSQFIEILRTMKYSRESNKILTIKYARTLIDGLGPWDAKELVDAL